VPIGGKYRLIDIPISNCLHAGIRRIFVLTQFNSASLNRHIARPTAGSLLAGVRRHHRRRADAREHQLVPGHGRRGARGACRTSSACTRDHYLILAGDHLYRMDFDEMSRARQLGRRHHHRGAADDRRRRRGMGIFRFDRKGQIEGFEEKPSAARLEEMGGSLPAGATTDFTTPANKPFVASMGIYVFTRKALVEALAEPNVVDFGHEIIPKALGPAEGARLRLRRLLGRRRDPALVLRRQHLPDAAGCRVQLLPLDAASLLAAALPAALVDRWRVAVPHRRLGRRLGLPRRRRRLDRRPAHAGLRRRDGEARRLLGADEYDDRQVARRPATARHRPRRVLENVIVDKNARIGDGAILVNSDGIAEGEGPGYVIREGIIVGRRAASCRPAPGSDRHSTAAAAKGGAA
jgi:glucose-1-phosphate adenylyltransferase